MTAFLKSKLKYTTKEIASVDNIPDYHSCSVHLRMHRPVSVPGPRYRSTCRIHNIHRVRNLDIRCLRGYP